jgi:hypothetical protein
MPDGLSRHGRARIYVEWILVSVVLEVAEDVVDRVTDLGWSAEGARVVAVGEHAATAVGGAVDAFGDADGEALEATREGELVVRLDDEVNVVGLHGEFDEA